MNKIFTKILDNIERPPVQGLLMLFLMLVLMLGGYALQYAGIMSMHERFPWMIVTACLLIYAVFSSVSSIATGNMNQYWSQSIFSFFGITIIGGLLAWGISGLTIFDAGSYSWLFQVVMWVYVIFMAIVRSMRNIVDFAQKEEWSRPKVRNNKNN
jgi:hypothetical protein